MLTKLNRLIYDLKEYPEVTAKLKVIAKKLDSKKNYLLINVSEMDGLVSPGKVDPVSYSDEVGRIEIENV